MTRTRSTHRQAQAIADANANANATQARITRALVAVAMSVALGCSSTDDNARPPDAGPRMAHAAAPAPAPTPAPAPEPAPAEPAPEPTKAAPEPAEAPPVVAPPEVHQPIENLDALAPFYRRLAELESSKTGVVRVVHLGASMIGADDLPSVLREKFQTRFGDGGAGLVLLQRYMPNYMHRWVTLKASGWDHCYIAYLCKKDGHYGLGGTTFWSTGGATTTLATRDDELGDTVSHLELWYLAHPRGGRISIRVDKGEAETLETRADALEDRYHALDVEDGPHKVEVRARGGGQTRAYGVVMETAGPGIVWDQFSMLGAFTKRLLAWDETHIKGQIAHRDPDLIVFTYGGNDLRRVTNGRLTREGYKGEYVQVIKRARAGKPDAACLVTSITDRGKSLHFTLDKEDVETIVAAQRDTALEVGCAFFDSYTAMGGAGSLKRWMRAKPPLAAKDEKHLNHRGRVRLGGWMYDAIMAGYVVHKARG